MKQYKIIIDNEYCMFEQQFLTTFNTITNYNETARLKDKKSNLIVDYINATYQGYLNHKTEPDGLGIAIDDQFNFILCSNWKAGKLDGHVFIKLANEVSMWGTWKNNQPRHTACVKIGPYLMFIPVYQNHNQRRPRKCLIAHEGKGKIYLTVVQKYPQGTQSKRQFSIVIQKIISMKAKTVLEIASEIDLNIQPYEQDMLAYLNFMSQQIHAIKLSQKQNSLFVTANFKKSYSQLGMTLGLLLDRKRLITKTVGMFSVKKKSQTFRQNNAQDDQEICLNGLGLSKTLQSQVIIGVFKDDMLIRQLNSQQRIESIRSSSKNFSRNLNGSVVKELLCHQHMRSLSYEHNYIYFPSIKNIINVVVEIHKYVEMFERLSHQGDIQDDESMNHHQNTKYQRNQDPIRLHESKNSIIDQFVDNKVNLKKEIYHLRQQQFQNQNAATPKRPGFILNRVTERKERTSKSRSNSPHPELNKRLPQRSPLKTQQKWRI